MYAQTEQVVPQEHHAVFNLRYTLQLTCVFVMLCLTGFKVYYRKGVYVPDFTKTYC